MEHHDANKDIRSAINKSELKYWQVAAAYGCADSTFSRKLRHELPQEKKQKVFAIIDDLIRERDLEVG